MSLSACGASTQKGGGGKGNVSGMGEGGGEKGGGGGGVSVGEKDGGGGGGGGDEGLAYTRAILDSSDSSDDGLTVGEYGNGEGSSQERGGVTEEDEGKAAWEVCVCVCVRVCATCRGWVCQHCVCMSVYMSVHVRI